MDAVAERGPHDRSGPAARTEEGQATATLSIIIVSFKCRSELEACLASLEAERPTIQLEVIVVDNASHDGTVESVAQRFPWVQLFVNEENEGFARAANRAMRLAEGKLFLLLNPDTLVPPGALSNAADALTERPEVGMLGCKVVGTDGSFDHACKRGFPTVASALYHAVGLTRLMPTSARFAHYTAGHLAPDEAGLVDAVAGAFMLVRREAVDAVGPMDEQFWMYGEDLDWCRRFWKEGWQVLYWPTVQITHVRGASGGGRRSLRVNRAFYESLWLFYQKYHAPQRTPLVSSLVFAGIWTRFVVSVAWGAAKSVGRSTRS